MTTTPTPRDDAAGTAVASVAADALHGSYCPKMCSFACPVTGATGEEHAVPWGFHRTVSDLATGRLSVVAEVADRLALCTGCLACQVPCSFDQDVPSQVRAGRAALVEGGVAPGAVAVVSDHVAAGRTPSGDPTLEPPPADTDPTTVVVTGCRDDAASVAATVTLLHAAGERVAVHVPDGCCGGLLADLGDEDAAGRARTRLAAGVSDARVAAVAAADPPDDTVTVVATDPHCLPSLRSTGVGATDLASHLDAAVTDGRLRFVASAGSWSTTWHDPCVLARGEGVVAAPRRVLAAAGADLDEPEHTGDRTACSGAGMGLDLLAPDAAAATAAARARDLGNGPVVTGCARARDRLRAAGVGAHDLASTLVHHLDDADHDPPGEPT